MARHTPPVTEMKLGRVASPSTYLAMIAIDAEAIAAYGGTDWDDAKQQDVGDCGRAHAQLQRRKFTLKVGDATGVLAEIGGCGMADIYRFGTALVIPEHYTGDDDAEAEAMFERVIATHPTTKPVKLGTVDVPSGVLVLKGLFEPGTKVSPAKAKRGPVVLADGLAVAVPPGKFDVWTERFKKEPEGAWGSMSSRTRIVPAGTKLKEGAPIAELPSAPTPKPGKATKGERRIALANPPWFATGAMAIADDGRAFAGECGTAHRVCAWNADGTFAWQTSVGPVEGKSPSPLLQLVGDELIVRPYYGDKLVVLDARTGKRKRQLTLPARGSDVLVVGKQIVLRPSHEIMIASYPALVECARFAELYVSMSGIALAPDTRSFAAIGHQVHVFDLAKRKHLRTWSPASKRSLWAATYTPDGKVVTGDDEATVEIRDPATGKLLATIDAAPSRSSKPAISAIAASSKYIAAGRLDGCVALIDRAKQRVVRELDKHHVALPDTGATFLAGVAFGKDGSLWVSAGPKKAPVGLTRYVLDQ